MKYLELYGATLLTWVVFGASIYFGVLLETVAVILAVTFNYWLWHVFLFATNSNAKVKAIVDMCKLLPYYLSTALKAPAAAIYPILYPIRLFHWLYEDEEDTRHTFTGVHKGNDASWVVDLVLDNKPFGEAFTAWETFLLRLYWEGNRNIMANFDWSVLALHGAARDFIIVTNDKKDESVTSDGIGYRRKGYSHTRERYGDKVMPQFTYMSDRLFVTSGFGSSRVIPRTGVIHGFEVSNRIAKH